MVRLGQAFVRLTGLASRWKSATVSSQLSTAGPSSGLVRLCCAGKATKLSYFPCSLVGKRALAGGDCATKWLHVNLFHVLGLVGIITRLALLREDSFLLWAVTEN